MEIYDINKLNEIKQNGGIVYYYSKYCYPCMKINVEINKIEHIYKINQNVFNINDAKYFPTIIIYEKDKTPYYIVGYNNIKNYIDKLHNDK